MKEYQTGLSGKEKFKISGIESLLVATLYQIFKTKHKIPCLKLE